MKTDAIVTLFSRPHVPHEVATLHTVNKFGEMASTGLAEGHEYNKYSFFLLLHREP